MKNLICVFLLLICAISNVFAQFTPPTTIIQSDYDYAGNSPVGNRTIFYNDTIHTINLVRPFPPSPPTVRHVVYSRSAFFQGPFEHFSAFNGQAGFPQLDIATRGGIQGKIGITDESSSEIAIFNGTGFDVKSTPPGPTFVFSNGKIILWSISEAKIYKSTDLGNTFVVVDSLSRFHPDIIYNPDGFGIANIVKSKSEQYLAIVGSSLGDGHVYSGIPENRADNVWMLYSTDYGETWDGKRIAADGVQDLVQGYHTSNFAPLFENFGQVDAAIDDSGKIHVAANGYGVVLSGSNVIGEQFPVLYWNSVDDFWISISGIEIDTLSQIANYYPSPLIGQSYPAIETFPSLDPNQTSSLMVYWTGPQTNISSPIGFDTSDGYYLTDIYYNRFIDNWSPNSMEYSFNTVISETFANAGKDYSAITGIWKSYVTFIEDQSPGISVFSQGDQTLNPIRIAYYDFTFPSVEDETYLNGYVLNQNYPNPFNPTTIIRYSIPEFSKVNLKVYDILGNEVATLVDEEKPAGNFEVVFDGSSLSSGVYFYKMTAGNYSASKKFILLK